MATKGAIIAAAARIICEQLTWNEVEVQMARREIERTWHEHNVICKCGISLEGFARIQIYESVLPSIRVGEYVSTQACQN